MFKAFLHLMEFRKHPCLLFQAEGHFDLQHLFLMCYQLKLPDQLDIPAHQSQPQGWMIFWIQL